MANVTIKNIEDKKVWEDFLAGRTEANFLQSWYWGEFHKALGNVIHRVGFYIGDVLAAVMLSVVEDARRGRYLTVPAGPIMDWADENLVESFTKEIKNKLLMINAFLFGFVRSWNPAIFPKSFLKN